MNANDKTEKVLREIHIMLSKAEPYKPCLLYTSNINYKLVIEKILKIVIRQVLMIYIVYSAQK